MTLHTPPSRDEVRRHRAAKAAAAPRPPASRLTTAFAIVSLVVAGVLALLAGTVLAAKHKYEGNITRIDTLSPLPGKSAKPAEPRHVITGPVTFLVVGSDARAVNLNDPAEVARTGGQRTDTIMLVHLTGDHSHAFVISIPRDTLVDIPPGGPWRGGRGKINASFEYGGAPLLVRTVQQFTGVQINHVVIVNFAGFRKMTDALGGVDVVIDKTTYDERSHRTFYAGVNHLNGSQALDFVRQRYGLPGSDFDRMKRQQQFLHALMDRATSLGVLTNPVKLNAFLDAATKSITVDRDLNVTDTALQMRGLRAKDFTFVLTPIARDANNTPWGSVLIADEARDRSLFAAVANDTVAQWTAANPAYLNDPTHGR